MSTSSTPTATAEKTATKALGTTVKSGEICPESGSWELVDNSSSMSHSNDHSKGNSNDHSKDGAKPMHKTTDFAKGATMTSPDGKSVTWKLTAAHAVTK